MPDSPKPNASSRIPTLDGLRAISILLVLIGHAVGNQRAPASIRWFLNYANFGVRIFFIISGFLITGLLLKELRKTGAISLKKFYLRRVFRIFPASYTYIAVVALAAWAGIIALRRFDLHAAALYWMNFHFDRSWWLGHLWSLSVEEQFYLIWPAVLAFGGLSIGKKAATAVFFLSPLLRLGMIAFFPGWAWGLDSFFPAVADTIAAGCLLACFRDELWGLPTYRKLLESRFFPIVPVAAVLGVVLAYRQTIYFGLLNSLINVCIAMTIDWCTRNSRSLVGRFLEWAPMAYIGTLSYSLYLWQQPWLNYKEDALIGNPLIGLAGAFLCAALSYHVVEKPFLAIKDRYFSSV